MNHKKIFLIFFILIVVLLFLVSKEINDAKKIKLTYSDKSIVENQIYNIPITAKDHFIGNPGAELIITEFVNLNTCDKECQEKQKNLINFVEANPTKIKLIWKDAPSDSFFVPDNKEAHQALYCAGEQNKFWEFQKKLLEKKTNLSTAGLSEVSEELKLNKTLLERCLNDEQTIKQIDDNFNIARALNTEDNPTIFMNNKRINVFEDINFADLLNRFLPE